MYIQDDESLQSAIFRSTVLSGESSFENVLGDNGYWLHKPKGKGLGCCFFQSVDDGTLFELVRRSGLVKMPEERFSNLSPTVVKLSEIFADDNINKPNEKGKLQVGFCEKCIRESIEKLGFGYFKSEWLNWKTDKQCTHHNISLCYIVSSSRKKTVASILRVLAGDFSVQVTVGRKKYIDHYPFHLNFESPSQQGGSEICYLPCTKWDLYCWLSKNIDRLNENINLRKSLWFKNFSSYSFFSDETLEFMCAAIELNDIDGMDGFIHSYLEKTSCRHDINGRFLFQYSAYKSKFQNCSKCVFYSERETCPKFAIIQVGNTEKRHMASPTHTCGVMLETF
jgi:hypothetical protein